MNARIDEIASSELGERLRKARVAAELTQEDVADKLSLARTTVVAIEKGQRRVKSDELIRFSQLYKISANRLLSSGAVHIDLFARFRRENGEDPNSESAQAVRLLTRLATASLELERLLGIQFVSSYAPPLTIQQNKVSEQAEDAAIWLRQKLGLGLSPISDIISMLELELGIRIFVRTLPSKISGLYAFEPTVGACMLINEKHSRERRAMSAAHETGHFITCREYVDVLEENEPINSIEERFATAFGVALLMPATAIRQRFREYALDEGRFSPRHLILLSHAFYVSPEAMCRRLEGLALLPNGTYDSLKERGFSRRAAEQAIGEEARSTQINTPRLSFLASEAFRRGLVTEGQLSDKLSLDRIAVRQLLDAFDTGESDDDQLVAP